VTLSSSIKDRGIGDQTCCHAIAMLIRALQPRPVLDGVSFLDDLGLRHPLYRVPETNFVIYSRRWKQPVC
jgi:hypothetical protein